MTSSFPSRAPLCALIGAAIGLAASYGGYRIWRQFQSPLQVFYLGQYAKASLAAPLSKLPRHPKPSPRLIIGEERRGKFFCLTPETYPSATALKAELVPLTTVAWRQWLQGAIYDNQPVTDYMKPLLMTCLGLFLASVMVGGIFDSRRRNKAKTEGQQRRGPELVSRWKFNWRVRGDGFSIKLLNRRNPIELLLGARGRSIRIKRKHENNHIITMADPGGGKTSFMMQVLDQVKERGETAIIYDPHMQFVPRYYDESRGDIILNPLDDRCPSWSPSEEVDLSDRGMAEANAMAMANSLFPGKPTDRNWFFIYCSQLIFKHCVVEYQPDAHELAHLMQYSDPLIDEAVKGTELVQMMAENAQNQRAGVVGHLTQIAFSLRQIPRKDPSRRHTVLHDWCKTRKGWIFLTNSQNTRDGLRPLQSLWLDWLILCLLSQGERPDLPPVMMAIDEAPTLQQLPQLMSLMTEGRKSLRVMLGIQGKSQFRDLYGEKSEAILSAPFTKLLMRTSEPDASRWLCESVGEVEREYLKETIPAHVLGRGRGGSSWTTDRRIEKLLLGSEFKGLDDLHGYLSYGNYLLPVHLPIMPKIRRAPKFIPRIGQPVNKRPLPTLEGARKQKAADIAATKDSAALAEARRQHVMQKELARLFAEDARAQAEASADQAEGAEPSTAQPAKRPPIPPKNQQQLPLEGASS